MNIHFPIPRRTQVDTETSVYQLFQDITDLMKDVKDPMSKRFVQENFEDLLDAKDKLEFIIKESRNG